jgi:GNAT superfamily N-acetyltransferase
VIIRLLTTSDVPQALALSSQAGWNQTGQDWQTLLALAPDSCFGLDCDFQLAATTTLICYGQTLAWLGMVLTKPEFQRRGFARLLVKYALDFADAHAIGTVKLDATHLGEALYESVGFIAEQPVERWFSEGVAPSSLTSPATNEDEFVKYREGLRARYLGPCRARSVETAERLIGSVLSQLPGPWLWDLLPSNQNAVALATSFGFRCQRKLIRMRRGVPLFENVSEIYAIRGFELG